MSCSSSPRGPHGIPRDPRERYVGPFWVVERELQAYGHGLVDRPRLLVLNKQELASKGDLADIVRDLEQTSGRSPLCVSAAMGANLDGLLDAVWKQLGV